MSKMTEGDLVILEKAEPVSIEDIPIGEEGGEKFPEKLHEAAVNDITAAVFSNSQTALEEDANTQAKGLGTDNVKAIIEKIEPEQDLVSAEGGTAQDGQEEGPSSQGVRDVKRFSAGAIREACNGFAEGRIIGQGFFGVVYHGRIQYLDIAIKKLKQEGALSQQLVSHFHKEVDLHGSIHHPNIVILMGCCEDPPCLVNEYMCNGSLEDRLLRMNGTRPLPWHLRYSIMRDTCRALVHLHEEKPAITHLDVKPANILLGGDFAAKLGGVGLAQLMVGMDSGRSFKAHSRQQGTYGYACPQYLYNGEYGPRSDVYGLGMIFWDVLGGLGYRDSAGASQRGAKEKKGQRIALVKEIEQSVAEPQGAELTKLVADLCRMDPSQGSWPMDVAVEVARLAVECAQYERNLRPAVRSVASRLEQLVNRVEQARREPPPQFVCCITNDVMVDPVVAADGHSYERAAIERWLREHRTSPYTRELLSSEDLRPNLDLRSLISEWKEEQQALGLSARPCPAAGGAGGSALATPGPMEEEQYHATSGKEEGYGLSEFSERPF